MITAGPTFEKIDPVRFIGNYSSGKMGYAIAEEIAKRGGDVKLISGPVKIKAKNRRIETISVESASQMYDACCNIFPKCDGAIMAAAVADFTPSEMAENKIKRKGDSLTLTLVPTKDIASEIGKMKSKEQFIVGFALEKNDELNNAQSKLERKNLDFIVLNSFNDKGAGFMTDTNKITIIDNKANKTEYPLKLKSEVASDIVDK